jgi:hypothetical protein
MRTALLITITGAVLLCAGLALSPLPWLALVAPGVALVATGLLKDFE